MREARDRVSEALAREHGSVVLQEFSKPVICRNKHTVVIRRVSDQWFLRYGDPAWKAATRAGLPQLTTWPAEYRHELDGILDWFGDRPCARQGRWLGTPLPFDPSWIVEPIADSTIYMAYFVVRRFVARGRVRTEQLSDAFFDRVFLGRGEGDPAIDRALQDEIRAEFLYWYPLDLNIGGKEHKNVHFPVFLYTHARLFPKELQPRGIFLNGWITGPTGLKLSKKDIATGGKGTIPPLDRALDSWGADALRLYFVTSAAPPSDLEFESETVEANVGRLDDIARMVRATRGDARGPPELSAWLASEVHRSIERARAAMDAADVRAFAEEPYVRIPALLRRYYARGAEPDELTDRVGRAWIRLLAIVTPYLAEELGEGRLPGLAATESFPDAAEFPLAPVAEAREAYLDHVEEDLRAVLRPAIERGESPPDAAVFFLAAPWKTQVEAWMREAVDERGIPTIRTVMERAKAHPELRAHLAEIPKYVERVGPLLRGEPAPTGPAIDELATLRSSEAYLARRLGFGSVVVVPETEGAAHDPLGRRDRARPGRPAFFLVRPDSGPKG